MTSSDNPFVAKSIVNRVWFHLLGRGIVDPVDDFRDSNPSANDELLDALAKDFTAHKFDLKHLIRTIALSRTYQLEPLLEPNAAFNKDDTKYFSHAVTKLLSALEQLFDAICSSDPIGRRSSPACRSAPAPCSCPTAMPTIRSSRRSANRPARSPASANGRAESNPGPGAAAHQRARDRQRSAPRSEEPHRPAPRLRSGLRAACSNGCS